MSTKHKVLRHDYDHRFPRHWNYTVHTSTCHQETLLPPPSSPSLLKAVVRYRYLSALCSDNTTNSRSASACLRGTRLELRLELANGREKIETTAHPSTSQG